MERDVEPNREVAPRAFQFRLRTVLLLMVGLSVLFAGAVIVHRRMNRQPTVRVVLLWPGASVEECDRGIGNQLDFIAGMSPADAVMTPVDSWTIVSYPGKVELYATAPRGADGQQFLEDVEEHLRAGSNGFPEEVALGEPELLGDKLIRPNVVVKQTNEFEINIDRDRVALLGLTLADVQRQLAAAIGESKEVTHEAMLKLQNAVVKTPAGESVKLRDIAEVRMVQKPNAIVRESR
jgi:multidrug efflux pump subunit AcrB